MKERDRAIDEIRIKATQLSNAREENEQLKRHTDKLNSDLIQVSVLLKCVAGLPLFRGSADLS